MLCRSRYRMLSRLRQSGMTAYSLSAGTSTQRPLNLRISEIEKTIEAYRGYIQLSNEVDLIVRYAKGLEQDLTRYDIAENEEEKAIEYHPKEYFDTEFQTTVSEDMDSILRECQYLNLTGARFNLSSFDIEVNGETKASHGKGYHSYLNTVVALAFRNYFHDHAKYNADFLIIDTPLHGFDENDTELPDSMKDGLFKYFVHHLTGQLIIVENTDHVPSNIDFEVLGANVITFTKKGSYTRPLKGFNTSTKVRTTQDGVKNSPPRLPSCSANIERQYS